MSGNAKPQPTLKGYIGWAFTEYVRADDQEPGPTAEAMIADWIRSHAEMLEEQYDITRERYRHETGLNVAGAEKRFGQGKEGGKPPRDGAGK